MLHVLFQTLFILFADIFSPWADELYNFFRSRLLLASHMFTVFFRRHVQLGCVFMMPFVSSAQSVHSTRLKKWVSFGVGNLERLNCTGPSLQVSCSEPPGVVTTTNPSLFMSLFIRTPSLPEQTKSNIVSYGQTGIWSNRDYSKFYRTDK